MIHWTPEGQYLETGLNVFINFQLKNFWFRFIWVSVNLPKREATSYYFRVRTKFYPFFIFDKASWDIVDTYLWNKNLMTITQAQYEDYIVPSLTENV